LNTIYNYSCVENNTIYIAVGSEDGNEGNFNITITETGVSPTNDICEDLTGPNGATDLGTLNDCEWQTFTLNNSDACPENFDDVGCDLDTDPVVWYSITLPINASGLEVGGLTAGYVAIYASCPLTGGNALAPGCVTEMTTANAIEFNSLSGGSTYFIAAGNTVEGAFDVQLKAIVPPTNDDCDVVLNPALTNGVSVDGTTNCAGPSFISGTCSLNGTDSHDVFYSYTNSTGVNQDINITVTGNTNTTNQMAADISVLVITDACDGTLFDANSEICNTLGTAANIECIADGETIIIMIGSSDGDEGDFSIVVDEVGVQPADNNDECTNPLNVTPANTCEWTMINGTTLNACPEDFADIGICDFNGSPTVWYQIDAPAVGTDLTLEIRNLNGTGTPFLAVFDDISDCDNPNDIAANMGGGTCITGAGPVDYDITAGSSYYIAFGDDMGGAHDFEIRIVEPPANNTCDPDAIALTDGTATEGTTACATEDDNGYCTFLTNDNSHVVYYEYTVVSTINTQLTITVAGSTATTGAALTGASIGVWTDCVQSEDYNVTNPADMGDVCDALAGDIVFQCVAPGEVLTIAVGSADMEEGDFSITVTEDNTGTLVNDRCDAPTGLTDPAVSCVPNVESVDNTGACPEDTDMGVTGCTLDMDNVLWFSVTLPADATGILRSRRSIVII